MTKPLFVSALAPAAGCASPDRAAESAPEHDMGISEAAGERAGWIALSGGCPPCRGKAAKEGGAR